MLEQGLNTKHPFVVTMPFYTLPHTLKVVNFARISFGSKTAGFRRKTYPTIARHVSANQQGTPTYVSERALSVDVLSGLMNHFDARLLIGAPHLPDIKFLHLSDQVIAQKRLGSEMSIATLGNTLFDVYEDNERLLSKAKKYFSPATGSYAEMAAPMLDEAGSKTKVILIPDFNSAFRMREAEAVAKTLFDSGRYFPWIVTTTSQRTTCVNFSALNSSKVNPATSSEIVLFVPPINLGHFISDTSFSFSKSTNLVHIMAYDYNPTDADVGTSICIPSHTEEIPNVVQPVQSGYDTDPGTRFVVDFAVTRQSLRTSKILDKLAKSCKFWPSPELTFRQNRHLRFTLDFSSEKAMMAFLNFCDNTKGHFAYPRNEVPTAAPTSTAHFIRVGKGENDPDAFLLVLQTLFNIKNSEMFPVGNLTAVIHLPGNIDLPKSLRAANAELDQDYFLSTYAPGGHIVDLRRKLSSRERVNYRPQTRSQSFTPEPDLAWFSVNGGDDFSNHLVIAQMAKHIKADNVSRAWSLANGSSIIFTLPVNSVGGTFEHGGRSFSVSPFTLGSDLIVSPVSLEPDFDKIFELDSNNDAALDDDLHHKLISMRHLRTNLGLDALSAAHDAGNLDELMVDPAQVAAGPGGLLDAGSPWSGSPGGAEEMQVQPDVRLSQPKGLVEDPSPDNSGTEEGEASEANEGDDLTSEDPRAVPKGSPSKKPKKDSWTTVRKKKPKKKKVKDPTAKIPVATKSGSPGDDIAKPKDPGKPPQ